MPARRGRPPKNRHGIAGASGQVANAGSGIGNDAESNPGAAGESASAVIPGKPIPPTPEERQERLGTLAGEIFEPAKSNVGFDTPVGSEQAKEEKSEQPEPIRRGRPLGSKSKQTISASGLEKLLFANMAMLKNITGVPEFDMNQTEAQTIAEAWAECAKYYPSLALAPEIAAPVNLGSVLTIAVFSRVAAFKMRRGFERAARTPQSPIRPATPQPQPQPQRAATTQEQVNGIAPQQSQSPSPPIPTQQMRTGTIPGVTDIEFPPDHELVSGRKH